MSDKFAQSKQLEEDFARYIAKKHALSFEDALARVRAGTHPKAPPKKRSGTAPGKFAPKKKPLTTAKRIARRLGPDDGRKGGSPTVQGGSPGLGKRR